MGVWSDVFFVAFFFFFFFKALQAGGFSTLSHSLSYEIFASGIFIAFVIGIGGRTNP